MAKRPKARKVRRSFAVDTTMTASADGSQVIDDRAGQELPWDPGHVPAPSPPTLLEQLVDYQARALVRAELKRGADEAGIVLELDDDPDTYERDIGFVRYEVDQLCRRNGLEHLADRELSRFATREATGMDLEYAQLVDQISFAIARARDRQSS